MNKYQKALEELAEYAAMNETLYLAEYTLIQEYKAGLQELVDNATPKKVAIQEIGQYIIRYVGECECGEFIAGFHVYCPGCGQKIDWSKE